MFGPAGTAGGAGAGPRVATTNAHSSDAPWFTHLQAEGDCGEPSALFNGAGVSTLATPVDVSPTHSSIPASRVCVNANRVLSGENPTHPIAGLGGSVTLRSTPSAGLLIVRWR